MQFSWPSVIVLAVLIVGAVVAAIFSDGEIAMMLAAGAVGLLVPHPIRKGTP